MQNTTMYLCKGNKPICFVAGCAINGGDCKHTTDPQYAINGECTDPQNHPERFEPEKIPIGGSNGRTVIYFWEKEKETEEHAEEL